jgi:hypothetical protein
MKIDEKKGGICGSNCVDKIEAQNVGNFLKLQIFDWEVLRC